MQCGSDLSGSRLPGHDATAFYIGPALDAYCAVDPTNARPTFAPTFEPLQTVFLEPGATVDFGTCITPGSSASGDTYVNLIDADYNVVVSNDNGGGSCGLGSHASYTVPRGQLPWGPTPLSAITNIVITPETAGSYQLRMGCYGATTCSGTEAYVLQ